MPQPNPRPSGQLRRVDEPHPIEADAQRSSADRPAEKQAPKSDREAGNRSRELVTITHRVPGDLRNRLKIAAIQHGRREQDIVADAISSWLDDHESR